MLLFIDYDDTLHPSWTFHDGAQRVTAKPYTGPWLVEAPTLERILRPYLPGLEIVISSLWARTKGLEMARGMLPPALADRVIGSIWSTAEGGHEPAPCTRYDAIRAWLDAQRPEHGSWLALDDDDRGWPAHERHRLVHARGTLADPKVQQDLADRLGAQMKDEIRAAILERVTLLNGGDRNRAQSWYSDYVLCDLGNKTPEEHVLAGHGAGVLDYVENLGAGATG